MFLESKLACSKQILCCDPQPDSRSRTTEKLATYGYTVLSTGNPQIAAAMTSEKPFSALVFLSGTVNLTMLNAIIESRRNNPALPILVLLSERGGLSLPPGVADIVLVNPADSAVRGCLEALTETPELATMAS
jgi:CheY-like chemotaxis protein